MLTPSAINNALNNENPNPTPNPNLNPEIANTALANPAGKRKRVPDKEDAKNEDNNGKNKKRKLENIQRAGEADDQKSEDKQSSEKKESSQKKEDSSSILEKKQALSKDKPEAMDTGLDSKKEKSGDDETRGEKSKSAKKNDGLVKKDKTLLKLNNFAGILRIDDIRKELAKDLLFRKEDPKILNESLQKIIITYLQNGKIKTNGRKVTAEDEMISYLCYFLLGSKGFFGVYQNPTFNCIKSLSYPGLLPQFIIFEKWKYFESGLEFLMKYMKISNDATCRGYSKQELLTFIGKSFIYAFKEAQNEWKQQNLLEKNKSKNKKIDVLARIQGYFEKYKIDINMKTNLPRAFDLAGHTHGSSYECHFAGDEDFRSFLYGESHSHAITQLLFKLNLNFTLQELKDISAKNEIPMETRVLCIKYLMSKIPPKSKDAAELLETAINFDAPKNIILQMRMKGYSAINYIANNGNNVNSEILLNHMMRHGLYEDYIAFRNAMIQRGEPLAAALSPSANPILFLLSNKYFDENCLQILNYELNQESSSHFFKDLPGRNEFVRWFSGYVIDSFPYDEAGLMPESLIPMADKHKYLKLRNTYVFNMNTARLTPQIVTLLLDTLERIFYGRKPQFPAPGSPMPGSGVNDNKQYLSKFFILLVTASIPLPLLNRVSDLLLPRNNSLAMEVEVGESPKSWRGAKTDYDILLQQVFLWIANSMPKGYGLSRSHSVCEEMLLYLIRKGADPSYMLEYFLKQTYSNSMHLLTNILTKEQSEFLHYFLYLPEVKQKLSDNKLQMCLLSLFTQNECIDIQKAVNYLKSYTTNSFAPKWNVMLSAHLTGLPHRLHYFRQKNVALEVKELENTVFLIAQNKETLSNVWMYVKNKKQSVLFSVAMIYFRHLQLLDLHYKYFLNHPKFQAETMAALQNIQKNFQYANMLWPCVKFEQNNRGKIQKTIADKANSLTRLVSYNAIAPSPKKDFINKVSKEVANLFHQYIFAESKTYFANKYKFSLNDPVQRAKVDINARALSSSVSLPDFSASYNSLKQESEEYRLPGVLAKYFMLRLYKISSETLNGSMPNYQHLLYFKKLSENIIFHFHLIFKEMIIRKLSPRDFYNAIKILVNSFNVVSEEFFLLQDQNEYPTINTEWHKTFKLNAIIQLYLSVKNNKVSQELRFDADDIKSLLHGYYKEIWMQLSAEEKLAQSSKYTFISDYKNKIMEKLKHEFRMGYITQEDFDKVIANISLQENFLFVGSENIQAMDVSKESKDMNDAPVEMSEELLMDYDQMLQSMATKTPVPESSQKTIIFSIAPKQTPAQTNNVAAGNTNNNLNPGQNRG